MTHTIATKLVRQPDGSHTLVLPRASVQVIEGPDKGKGLSMEQPRIRLGSGAECELRLSDPTVSKQHLELHITDKGLVLRDLQSTNGTSSGALHLGEAWTTSAVTLTLGKSVLRVTPGDGAIEIPLSARGAFGGLLGQSRTMRQVFATLDRVAASDSTVLLEGESGTGKELAACAIHSQSPRQNGPYIVVDCGSIPPTLMESELFGHERGAFTGAAEARIGALEEANGGTVFLDEISELPLALQPRLLRFLERREVKRVGEVRHRKVDLRIIAATNKPLATEVEEQRFRQDLFYRLSVLQVELPPLRDRPEDIMLLAHHFLHQHGADVDAAITEEIGTLLTAHAWPGNVRELRNVVERLIVVPETALSGLQQARVDSTVIGGLLELPFHEARKRWQDLFEKEYVAGQLYKADGVVTKAAQTSGLPRPTFHRILRRHGLRKG